MAKPNPAARDALLEASQRLMLAQGYLGTSIDQVCQAVGVTKGALLHYFGTKEELAGATLERFTRKGGEAYAAAEFLGRSDPLERLEGYIDHTAALFQHPIENACLIGLFSQELSGTHPEIRQRCQEAFGAWSAALREMLDQVKSRYGRRRKVDTASLADHFVAVFEGAVTLARARGDVAPVRESLDHFKRYVRAVLVD
jgi:TetR/AcrR family transcriptional repressor of nem operon